MVELTLSDKIGDLIAESGLTYAQLAKKIGVSQGQLSKLSGQNGEKEKDARLSTLKAIATGFNVSLDWLAGLSESQTLSDDWKVTEHTTGLSEGALQTIQQIRAEGMIDVLNTALESPKFIEFVNYMRMLSSYAQFAYIDDALAEARKVNAALDDMYGDDNQQKQFEWFINKFDIKGKIETRVFYVSQSAVALVNDMYDIPEALDYLTGKYEGSENNGKHDKGHD